MFERIGIALLFAGALTAAGQPNVLVNGGFESNPPPNFGNNIPWSIAPWTLGTGQQANVVKVDGPGGFNYGISGPESDASAPGPGIAQHYLDIADGSNRFYQSFTPPCVGEVRFGGAFSTRANLPGTGSIEIRQGVGFGGPLVATTNPVSLPGGNSRTDPWTNVSSTAQVSAFQTYSFVVSMDNNLNFDNAFVRYITNCESPDPCCPPWNASRLEEMLIYQGSGGITAPFTLKFQPTALFSTQMQNYIDFVNSMNPAIQQITIHFRLHDGGTGATPVMGLQIAPDQWITWTAAPGPPPPTPTWFTAPPLTVNHWWYVHTGMYIEGGHRWFDDKCANNDVAIRIQVQQAAQKSGGAAAVLQIRRPDGRIVERPLARETTR